MSLSSQSLNSSTSFHCRLAFFAGGEAIFSDERRGGVLVGDSAMGAARVGGSVQARQSSAAVAALPHLRRRRHFPAAAVVMAGACRWKVTVRVWCPATWPKTSQAFNPLAKQHSYSTVNSAAVTTGCCLGQVGSPACAPRLPLATCAQVGEPGEVEGWGVGWVSWHAAGPAGRPATPQMGEVSWRGARLGDRTALIPPPTPARGEEAGGRSSVTVWEGRTSLDEG